MLLSGFEGENINPICNYDMFTCGFHSNIGKGKLYVLPLLLKTHNKEYYLPILRQLFKIISSVDSELDLPKYLKDLRIVDESEIIQDKADYLERIEDINKKLNNYKIIKSILVLKHDLLVDNLIFYS